MSLIVLRDIEGTWHILGRRACAACACRILLLLADPTLYPETPWLADRPGIISLSLGQTRRFELRCGKDFHCFLAAAPKIDYVFWVLSRPTEAWTYSLKKIEMYPKRILQMLQPTTLPSRTVSRSMRMGRTLQNYRTSLAFISFLFFFEVLSSRTETSAPWRDWLRSPWSQFRIVKWRQMHSNAARVGRPSNDTVGDTWRHWHQSI